MASTEGEAIGRDDNVAAPPQESAAGSMTPAPDADDDDLVPEPISPRADAASAGVRLSNLNRDRPLSVKNSHTSVQSSQFHKTSSVSSMISTGSEGTLHMKEILSGDSPLRKPFEEFVKKKFAVEALLLYDACVAYQTTTKDPALNEAEKAAKMQEQGAKIVAAHFVKDAPEAFDVPGGIRTMLVQTAEKKTFQKHSFDAVAALSFNECVLAGVSLLTPAALLHSLKDNFFFQFVRSVACVYVCARTDPRGHTRVQCKVNGIDDE